MFYVAGRIADKATPPIYGVVESGTRDPWDLESFSAAIAINKGGVASDYSFFTAADNSTEATRVMAGDLWIPTWTGDSITALDFSAQDARKWLRFYTSKTNVVIDGSDEVLISAKVYTANKSAIDTTFGSNIDIIISSPSRSYKMRFAFSQGQASRSIVPDIAGEWIFSPSHNIGSDLCVDKDYIASFNSIA